MANILQTMHEEFKDGNFTMQCSSRINYHTLERGVLPSPKPMCPFEIPVLIIHSIHNQNEGIERCNHHSILRNDPHHRIEMT